ncbi:LexA family transcriptional regulator [uncultured Muribaculum sp.]|nr:LexA family transcriptional regulator [uncultured Muribaculum sp.]
MAKSTYISRTTLISIIGEQQSTPGYDVLRKIVEMSTASINETWLLTGEGEMYSKENPVPQISYTDGAPYYDESFELGFDELMAPSYENPEYLIRMPGYEKATLWCNASGHSMEPEINNGDIVALRRIDDFSFLPFGDIYGIITTNGLRTIKRLGKSATPGCYRLIPTNPEYDEQDIPLEKILIVYRVMGAMKSF